MLNPNCGFAPGSAAKIDTGEGYPKLEAEADAARLLRKVRLIGARHS
jgi:5-methyltetrahydropteroyltriglutamate--homocysteine methyltransferase